MRNKETHLIVGAGLAGAKAAEGLRSEGFAGRIVLIGDEAERPYERPLLSKGYLQGDAPREQTFVHPEAFYGENDIELRTEARADSIDAGMRQVVLENGERLHFDRLLIASGAEPRRLAIPGADLTGVHYLRELGDADSLRAAFSEGRRLVVIGGGWIGAEVAASARKL